MAPALPSVVTGEEEPAIVSGTMSFVIYPNPTSGRFTLEMKRGETVGNVKVEIFGMRGEHIMSGEMTGERKHEFSLSDLPHGLYYVKIVAGNHVEIFKLVKTR
jgi:hypothetical protein